MGDEKRRRKGLLAGLLELLGEEDTHAQSGASGVWEHIGPPPEPSAPAGAAGQAVHAPVDDPDGTSEAPADGPTHTAMVEASPEVAPDATSGSSIVHHPPTAVEDRVTMLTSPDVARRHAVLEELATTGIDAEMVQPVSERLLYDPEVAVRTAALQVLAAAPEAVPLETVRNALDDPADAIRAGVVALALHHGADVLADLARLAGARPWPATQRAALSAFASLAGQHGVDDHQLRTLLAAVGSLDPAPTATEQAGFAAVARAVGHDRLTLALGWRDERLGAARLLLEEGSVAALRAVAELADDPDDDVRVASALARSMLAGSTRRQEVRAYATDPPPASAPPPAAALQQVRPAGSDGRTTQPQPPSASQPVTPSPRRHEPDRDPDLVAEITRTLRDPDMASHLRAATASGEANAPAVEGWARSSLRQGSEADAVAAARLAQALALTGLAGDILERAAAGVSNTARTDLVTVLANLDIDGGALVELARSVESSRRHEAIRVVWQVAGLSAIPHVKPLLAESSGPIRSVAIEIIGASGIPEAPTLARRVLETDSSPLVRAAAIKVLATAELDDRLMALAQALDDHDPDVRATAVEVLLEGTTRRASHLLLKAVEDPDERVRDTALRQIAALPDEDTSVVWAVLRQASAPRREELVGALEQQRPERLAELAELNRGSPNAQERVLAVELAGRAGTPESVRHTIAALRDPVSEVRQTAAAALSSLRSPEAIPSLAAALKDPNQKVRLKVVEALGLIDDDDVVPELIGALKDPEVRVREQASTVLLGWSSPAIARRLVEALAVPDLCQAAYDVLARMGRTAVEPLVEALLREDLEVASSAGALLHEVVGPDRFLDDLTSLDPSDRYRSVEALGAIGGSRAIDGLLRALSDPDEQVRVRALRQIGRLGDHRAYDDVRRTFATDPVLTVVEAAEETLRRLEPSDEDR